MVDKLSYLKLDRNKTIFDLNKDLIKNFNKILKNKNVVLLNKELSVLLNLPLSTFEYELYNYLFKNFDNREGSFLNDIKKKNYFKNLFFLIFLFFWSYVNKKKIKIKKYDLIIDNITINSFKKFKYIKKFLKTKFVSYKKIKNLKDFLNFSYFQIKQNKNNKISLMHSIKIFFRFVFINVYFKVNLNNYFIHIMSNFFKYTTIFSEISCRSLITEFNYTSELKNTIFKKICGSRTYALQTNIFQINGPGMFSTSDYLLSFGKSILPEDPIYRCKYTQVIPVGSLNMEYWCYKNKQKKNNYKYNVVLVASNHTGRFHSGYNSYMNEYIEHYLLLKKFAINNPNLSIAIKHKKKIYESYLYDMFSLVPNVSILIDKYQNINETYEMCIGADLVCSWSSSVIFELLGSGVDCYFLDPCKNNYSFNPNKFKNKITISSLHDFEKKYKHCLKKKNNIKVKRDYFCLNSKDCSSRIIKAVNL